MQNRYLGKVFNLEGMKDSVKSKISESKGTDWVNVQSALEWYTVTLYYFDFIL